MGNSNTLNGAIKNGKITMVRVFKITDLNEADSLSKIMSFLLYPIWIIRFGLTCKKFLHFVYQFMGNPETNQPLLSCATILLKRYNNSSQIGRLS
jgi:hypothetical protein